MDDQKIRIFNAITAFIQDLDVGFGKKYKPVALYNRLIVKTTIGDVQAIDRHISAFKTFFDENPNYIKNKQLANNIRIRYSDRVYLDLGHILSKTQSDEHKYIHQHLMTIYTLMHIDSEKGKEALETLKQSAAVQEAEPLDLNLPDTTEGNFIKDTLSEMTQQFENMNMDGENPMAMMSNIMQSGFFQKFTNDLQTKFNNGEMNLQSLMGTMTSFIGEAAPPGSEEAEQLSQAMSQTMNTVTNLTGGQMPNMPGPMDDFLKSVGANPPQEK